ncbi:MAG: UPF0175 family protein [Acidobacteriota bacterium]|nr:UPF0175 family protein [Acidobacteriota bacterium]
MKVLFEIDDDLVKQLTPASRDISRAALEALALEGYREGRLNDAEVRRMLGFNSRIEVDGFLKEHGVPLDYTMEDLEREGAEGDLLREKRQRELARGGGGPLPRAGSVAAGFISSVLT